MLKRYGLFLCLLIVAGALVQPLAAQHQQADEQHPVTCLHEAFEALAFLAGDWTVASRYRNADGDWEETTAHAAITYDMEGCPLVERYRGTRQETPFSARLHDV